MRSGRTPTSAAVLLTRRKALLRAQRPTLLAAHGTAMLSLLLAACSTPTERPARLDTSSVLIWELASTLASPVPTVAPTTIDPRAEEVHWSYGPGWEAYGGRQTIVDGIWAQGTEATLRFLSAVDGGRIELSTEIQPQPWPDGSAQRVAFEINGFNAGNLELSAGWERYRLRLSGEHVRVGRNRLVFRFAYAHPPPDEAEGENIRLLAARFRTIELALEGRGAWSERPSTIRAPTAVLGAPGPLATAEPAGAVEMPTGSYLDRTVDVPPGAELVGTVELDRARWLELGRAWATIEILEAGETGEAAAPRDPDEPAGTTRGQRGRSSRRLPLTNELFSVPLLGYESPLPLRLDLGAWADRSVVLRLRAHGSLTGVLIWRGVGLVTGGDIAKEPAPAPKGPAAAETAARAAVRSSPSISPGGLGQPDIVFVLLDAARPDAFSTFGGVASTPNIDALAAAGTRFDRAYSPSSWTGQSIASLLTGHYPESLGVTSFADRLLPRYGTIPEILSHAGYRTVLWSDQPIYHSAWYRRRFDSSTVVETKAPRTLIEQLPAASELFLGQRPTTDSPRRPAADTTSAVLDSQPTFALLHIVPPHFPYEPPAPFRGLLTRPDADPRLTSATYLHGFRRAPSRPGPTAAELAHIVARYRENAMYADAIVGAIVEELRDANRYDETLIVLMSDHGEAFFEHGMFLHTWTLYEEMIRVPLIVKWPASYRPRTHASQAGAVDTPVSLVDLLPTLIDVVDDLDATDLRRARGLPGLSLVPIAFNGDAPDRGIFVSTSGRDLPNLALMPLAAWIRNGSKIIVDPRSDWAELYDLAGDPGEQDDLASRAPVKTQQLLEELQAVRAIAARQRNDGQL